MKQPQLTHHIQLEILQRMLLKPTSRYSDLKPAQVEANLFMYHLRELMKAGLVEKGEKSYVLTRAGKQFADRVTLQTMKITIQPKIVTVLAITRGDGQWLIQERKNQPFAGFKGLPSGKLHYGETLPQAAERELYEKSGLQNVSLELKGTITMRFMDAQSHEPVNHVLGMVFYSQVPADCMVNFDQTYYRTYFAPVEKLFEPPHFKGHHEVLELLGGTAFPFVAEYEFTADY